MDPSAKILNFLDDHHIKYEVLEHEPVFTSEQAAKIRGTELCQGAKTLLLKTGGEFVLAVLPGERRLDTKKLKKILGVKDLRFALPEEVEKIMGCQIGACYPFGNLIGVRMVVDQAMGDNEIITFNIGRHDRSVKMRWDDYKNITKAEVVEIT
ncbi:MAG: YbaK/EbsC family protein [Candidatus Paceibacterota bacterium]|jgi:Ala-tRNA(Pro) deacylase